MATKKRVLSVYIVLSIAVVLFLCLGIFLLKKGYSNYETILVTYTEDNGLNYKVYLKDNDFFDTPYLEEGKTYITSLIDHISVSYRYKVAFNHNLKGKYSYYVKATIVADKPNNEGGTYWTKDYNLTEEKEMTVDGSMSYSVLENVDVDYDNFNKILNEFKRTMGLTIDAKLKVSLVISGDMYYGEMNVPINQELQLSLPLSELAIEGSVDTNVHNSINQVVNTIKKTDFTYTALKIFGIVFISVAIQFFVYMLRIRKLVHERNLYYYTLKKILNTYDSIIVNTNELASIKNLNVIHVNSFEELIDAHNEVRMPINYYQDDENGESYFMLINDKTVWQYILTVNNVKETKNERKK